MKIQIRIKQEGILRPERRAFADRSTPVTKVLKNARQAGARPSRLGTTPKSEAGRETAMLNAEYTARVDAVKRRAHGRWTEILGAIGIHERMLKRKPMVLPRVPRRERTGSSTPDKFGEGNHHCRKVRSRRRLQAAAGLQGNGLPHRAVRRRETAGVLPPARPDEPTPDRMKKLAQRIWNEARPITLGDEVDRYLRGRGLALRNYPPAALPPRAGLLPEGRGSQVPARSRNTPPCWPACGTRRAR